MLYGGHDHSFVISAVPHSGLRGYTGVYRDLEGKQASNVLIVRLQSKSGTDAGLRSVLGLVQA